MIYFKFTNAEGALPRRSVWSWIDPLASISGGVTCETCSSLSGTGVRMWVQQAGQCLAPDKRSLHMDPSHHHRLIHLQVTGFLQVMFVDGWLLGTCLARSHVIHGAQFPRRATIGLLYSDVPRRTWRKRSLFGKGLTLDRHLKAILRVLCLPSRTTILR